MPLTLKNNSEKAWEGEGVVINAFIFALRYAVDSSLYFLLTWPVPKFTDPTPGSPECHADSTPMSRVFQWNLSPRACLTYIQAVVPTDMFLRKFYVLDLVIAYWGRVHNLAKSILVKL